MGAEVDQSAEPAGVDEFLGLGVRGVELHHVAFLEEHAVLAACGDGFLRLGERESERLLAKDVFARLGGQDDLPMVAGDR